MTQVDTLLQQVGALTPRNRRELVRRLLSIPGFEEDLHDLALHLERRHGETRDYDEFRKELVAESRL